MSRKDPIIGRQVRIAEDVTSKGKRHELAGKEGFVLDRTPGGRQYRIQVGEQLINLPLDSFAVLGAAEQATGEGTVALEHMVPSLTNRKIQEDEALLALAATIKLHGILQPLLLRPLPPERLQDTFNSQDYRHAKFEIIAGERRFRAAGIAGLKRAPVLIVNAEAPSAVIMQLIENLHREDLNPLDEAWSLRALIDEYGLTREGVAEQVGKSRSHVFETLRLLDLTPDAKTAMRSGTLKRSMALLVAQRPTPALQQEYLQKVLTGGPDGGPMSYRAAMDLARRSYMTVLDQAPFALDDAALFPAAGACTQCPKRTGAAPELWDKDSADVCTDTSCFAAKREAHYAQITVRAQERGRRVITGAEARELMPSENSNPAGYILLDKPAKGASAPLRSLLGQDVPEDKVVLIEAPSGAMVEAMPIRAAGATLEAKGLAQPTKPAKQKQADPTREELEALYQQRWRENALHAVCEGVRAIDPAKPFTTPNLVVFRLLLCLARETDDAALHLVFPALPVGFDEDTLRLQLMQEVEKGPHAQRQAMLMLTAAWDIAPLFGRPTDEALQLQAAAEVVGVDIAAVKADVQEQMKAEAAERAQAAKPQNKAKPTLKQKADRAPKISQAEAQAAIAQALQANVETPAFQPGQKVKIKTDLKGPGGGIITSNGCDATVVRASGKRHWVVTLPDPWPFPGQEAKPLEVTADYTELEAL